MAKPLWSHNLSIGPEPKHCGTEDSVRNTYFWKDIHQSKVKPTTDSIPVFRSTMHGRTKVRVEKDDMIIQKSWEKVIQGTEKALGLKVSTKHR